MMVCSEAETTPGNLMEGDHDVTREHLQVQGL